jgi:hypothetical protein
VKIDGYPDMALPGAKKRQGHGLSRAANAHQKYERRLTAQQGSRFASETGCKASRIHLHGRVHKFFRELIPRIHDFGFNAA